MELIRGFHNLQPRHRGCVLAIGNFDGVHLGHQALISRLREHSAALKVPVAVQVFEPTPREFFDPAKAPGRIATFRGKLAALETAGVDRVLCARFDRRLAQMPAAQFVEEMLHRRLGVRALVVGADFRFGAGRGGDFALLQEQGRRLGFITEAAATVMSAGERVSSTAIREALEVPDLDRAARLLGRPYTLSGRVRKGLQLGRKLDMPTANIALHRRPALRFGIYAVEAVCGSRRWQGVANVGVRPTLANSACLLEAHLFGEVGDIYGAVLQVSFGKFLRPEQRFDSLDLLRAQMHADAQQARNWFEAAAVR